MIVNRRISKAPAMAQEGPRPLDGRETGAAGLQWGGSFPRSEQGKIHITFPLIRGPHKSCAHRLIARGGASQHRSTGSMQFILSSVASDMVADNKTRQLGFAIRMVAMVGRGRGRNQAVAPGITPPRYPYGHNMS
jgi:hypothetical protein